MHNLSRSSGSSHAQQTSPPQSPIPATQSPINTCKLVHVLEREGVHELLVVLLEQAGCRDVLPDQRGGGLCVAVGIDVHAKKNHQELGVKARLAPDTAPNIRVCRAGG